MELPTIIFMSYKTKDAKKLGYTVLLNVEVLNETMKGWVATYKYDQTSYQQ